MIDQPEQSESGFERISVRNLAAEQYDHSIRMDRARLMLAVLEARRSLFTDEQILWVLAPALGLEIADSNEEAS